MPLQDILHKYEEDNDKRQGSWIARHTNGAFDKNHGFGDWVFFDDNPITECDAYKKECDDEERK